MLVIFAATCLAVVELAGCGRQPSSAGVAADADAHLGSSVSDGCGEPQCLKPPCGPGSCAGCCAGTQCLSGSEADSCGELGAACVNCSTLGLTCVSQSGVGWACQAAPCNATTCPGGCCDGEGVCQAGDVNNDCGGGGQLCQDCTAPTGAAPGIASGGTCAGGKCVLPPACACASGCCDSKGACQPGASDSQCGAPGLDCQDCTLSNSQCFGQRCTQGLDAGVCNAQTCSSGCCQAGACQQGVTGIACGSLGTNCRTCLAFNQVCSNQQCVDIPDAAPSCNPQTCSGGCCDAQGNCRGGLSGAQCGTGGRGCVDCTTMGDECLAGVCTAPDGGEPCSQSCDGCCDASGGCQPGFTDAQCGDFGSTCLDCTSLNPPSTCDVNVSPRTCVSLQTECPGLYPACPPSLQQQAPVRHDACSMGEIANAASACAGGPNTAGCNAFFNLEAAVKPACVSCLQAFSYDFVDQTGIRLCVQPFVSTACNHNSACVLECVEEACYSCPDTPSAILCGTQVQSGACAAYYEADACVTAALNGAGAVCNPATYKQSYSAWFQAVGATYCRM
jgi:hypothetical protein